jgi:polyisoprenoid-binding protein YceI
MAEISTAAVEAEGTQSDRYIIDARASRFTVNAFTAGLLARIGHNPTIGIRDFSGELKFNPGELEAGSFRLLIKTASMSVLDDINDRDRREMERLMSQEVLETPKFPEILYEASNVSVTRMTDALYSATLNGKLTLHGVTCIQPIPVRVALFGSMLRASGDFSLNQTDYNSNSFPLPGARSS